MLYMLYAVYCMPYAVQLYTVQLYTQIPLSYGKGTPCYAVYCMLYAVLFTKLMQLPEFMHLRAVFVCVFTARAANVWGLGMGRARGLK